MSGGLELLTHSADQTRAVGRLLGALLLPGDVLVLTGDLGAGKTQLTKGIAEALGIEGEVTSPTFAIESIYEDGTLPLYHFDLYRLGSPDELGDAGVWDVLGGDGVCVFEWGERFADELGDERLDVFITREEGTGAALGAEPARRIRLAAHGPRAEELVGALSGAL